MRFFKRKENQEIRADPQGTVAAEESLLRALIGSEEVNKKTLLQIPTVKGCIDKLSGTVSRLPIRLYQKGTDGVVEMTEDTRLRLLNYEPGDTLNRNEFWRAMLEDYFLGKGGFAYIEKEPTGGICSLRYVKEESVSVLCNTDSIFKDYDIMVDGKRYLPFQFLKIRRNTKDGAAGIPMWEENPMIFSVAYNAMVFEERLTKKGGNKKGFIEAEGRLEKEAIENIKRAWRNLYSNDTENVVVLNKGAKFHESSESSVEMQLNENKKSNSEEICQLFGFPSSVLRGGATAEDRKEYLNCVVSLLTVIESALNRDLLLEKEKGSFYFAFDTREIIRGSQKERYEAYETALRSNFMQIDEIRELEDLPPLGINWLRIGLNDVLLDVESGTVYTPNTNKTVDLNNLKQNPTKGGEENAD